MGMFQKVNDWLAEKGDRFARGGDANRTPNSAYYASQEAEQAYGGMRKPAVEASAASESKTAGYETGRTAPVDRFSADSNDKYGGRVPYRSQKDMMAEAEGQRQQQEEQNRRQQAATQQMKAQQQFGRAPAQPAFQQPQQQGNIVQFPGMIRGPEGNLYAHVEYVVLLRSRNECTKVIEYIKANASVFLNMEFIANDSERQRCVDMLSGAAYTLGCQLNKISQRGIYLISSPSVCVVIDPAMQKYATAPEAQSYVRPDYTGYGGYGAQSTGYAAQSGTYAGTGGARASAYGTQEGGYAAARTSAYGEQAQAGGFTQAPRAAAYGAQQSNTGFASGARTAAYGAQANTGYTSGTRTAVQGAAGVRTAAYNAQTGFTGGQTGAYPAQSGYGTAAQTGAYTAQSGFGSGAQTGAYPTQTGYGAAAHTGAYAAQSGAQTGTYAAQPSAGFGAGAQTGAYAAQRGATPGAAAATSGAFSAAPKRAMPTFGMQGAFTKSAESGASR